MARIKTVEVTSEKSGPLQVNECDVQQYLDQGFTCTNKEDMPAPEAGKPAEPQVEVGSQVTFDDGKLKGTVASIDTTSGEAEVKVGDDQYAVDVADLTLA